jgi:hypothetical protein
MKSTRYIFDFLFALALFDPKARVWVPKTRFQGFWMEVNCEFGLVLGGSGAWQPWAGVWQGLATLEWLWARFGTPGHGPGKSWHVQDWSWQHQDWSWLHQDLPRTCPGKFQHCTNFHHRTKMKSTRYIFDFLFAFTHTHPPLNAQGPGCPKTRPWRPVEGPHSRKRKNSKNILRVSKNYETWGLIFCYGAKDCCKKSCKNSISRSLKKKLSFEKKVCPLVPQWKMFKLHI